MKKRILLIGHSGDLYGASRSLLKLAVILKEAEHEVFVLIPEKGTIYEMLSQILPTTSILTDHSLYIFTRKSFKLRYFSSTVIQFIRNVSYISSIIRKLKIDVIHTNSGVVPGGALAAKLTGKKHFWHIREWFGDFRKFWPLYSFYMTALSDKIICVSDTMSKQFKKSEKIVTIYNGFLIPEAIELPNLNQQIAWQLRDADLVIGCTSRIRLVRKGQEYLIEAVGLLTKRIEKNIQIVLVGDFVPGYEEQRQVLEKSIEQFNLVGRVHFLGHVNDVLPYYRLFDLFVLPSGEPEPFGGVVMEAMSVGLPVIGSNVGGTTEQIAPCINGFLFENKNPADLAEKIERFLIEPEKLKTFGEESKNRVNTLFSMSIHKSKILEIYHSI